MIEVDDHFRRSYSDDDNLNKAASFFSVRTVGGRIIIVRNTKKKQETDLL